MGLVCTTAKPTHMPWCRQVPVRHLRLQLQPRQHQLLRLRRRQQQRPQPRRLLRVNLHLSAATRRRGLVRLRRRDRRTRLSKVTSDWSLVISRCRRPGRRNDNQFVVTRLLQPGTTYVERARHNPIYDYAHRNEHGSFLRDSPALRDQHSSARRHDYRYQHQ